jgi:hypothetical protein
MKIGTVAATVVAAAVLGACGGGGDDGPKGKAEGVYEGTTSTGAYTQLLVLEDDSFWALYGTQAAGTFFVTGFVQGQGASDGKSFSSGNARDFGFAPPLAMSVSATYTPGTSISATLTAQGGSVTLNSSVIPAARFNYAAAPTIASIAGPWTMTMLSGATADVTISAAGAVSGTSQGCSFTGTIAPRPTGRNVFNVALTFGAAPCVLPNQSGAGVAVTYLVNGGPTRQLVVAGVDGPRNNGMLLVGTR